MKRTSFKKLVDSKQNSSKHVNFFYTFDTTALITNVPDHYATVEFKAIQSIVPSDRKSAKEL